MRNGLLLLVYLDFDKFGLSPPSCSVDLNGASLLGCCHPQDAVENAGRSLQPLPIFLLLLIDKRERTGAINCQGWNCTETIALFPGRTFVRRLFKHLTASIQINLGKLLYHRMNSPNCLSIPAAHRSLLSMCSKEHLKLFNNAGRFMISRTFFQNMSNGHGHFIHSSSKSDKLFLLLFHFDHTWQGLLPPSGRFFTNV